MPLDTSQVIQQGRTFVLGLSARQRALIALALIAVAGTLWVFVSLLGRGDYKVLYSGLDPEEANTIVKRLAQENIPAELSTDGKTLSVPESRLDKARLDMAAEGYPQSGRLGFEIFDQPNWGQSDFAEQVNYQRALEGELERTIQDLTDVEAVRVNLVLPHDSLFTEQQRQAKASVLVKLRNGRLSDRSLRAITYLVASSVDTLSPDNVTVIDANGNVPIVLRGGVKPGSPEGAAEYEQALDQKLTATLNPILGADHFVARATVEYDQDSSENTQETYDPKDSVVLTSQMTSNGGGDDGSSAAGVPGAASNVPQDQSGNANSPNNTSNPPNPNNVSSNSNGANGANGASGAAGQNGGQNGAAADDGSGDDSGVTSSSKTFAVGRTVVHTVKPPGTIRRITAAILVDNKTTTQTVKGKKTEVSAARTPAEMKQIQALASAVLGLDPARGDSVTVEDMPFEITPMTTSGPISGLQKLAPLVNQYGYLIRYLVLGLLGVLIFLFVIKPLMTQLTAPRELAGTPGGALPPGAAMGLPGAAPALASANGAPLEEPADARRQTAMLRESLSAKVSKAPVDAGRLIEGWLREDEK